jgi:hypothetical protein
MSIAPLGEYGLAPQRPPDSPTVLTPAEVNGMKSGDSAGFLAGQGAIYGNGGVSDSANGGGGDGGGGGGGENGGYSGPGRPYLVEDLYNLLASEDAQSEALIIDIRSVVQA